MSGVIWGYVDRLAAYMKKLPKETEVEPLPSPLQLLNRRFYSAMDRHTNAPTEIPRTARAFHRPDAIILHSEALSTAGITLGTEPVLRLALDAPDHVLGEAVQYLLACWRSGVAHPSNPDQHNARWLKTLGYRSWRAFETGARCCAVSSFGERLTITPLVNRQTHHQGGGFIYGAGDDLVVACGAEAPDIGRALRSAFERCS